MAEFQIRGLDEVLRRMRGLAPELKRRAARSAATKAMRIVRDAARAMAAAFDDPQTASNIAKNIVTRYDSKASKREGGVVVKVGVQGGARWRKSDPPESVTHWRYVELGTEDTAAQPFLRPALENNVSEVTDKFVAELDPAIDKALAKLR